jgi:hypothetical protein
MFPASMQYHNQEIEAEAENRHEDVEQQSEHLLPERDDKQGDEDHQDQREAGLWHGIAPLFFSERRLGGEAPSAIAWQFV